MPTNATLLFLVKREHGMISHVCLAMKKRGFGKGRWNGVGGKVKKGERIEAAAIREAEEEIHVVPRTLVKVAVLSFTFSLQPKWNQTVHAYISDDWTGSPQESEEMKPQWFSAHNLPYQTMWPDDIFWLPEVLRGNTIRASFRFGEHDVILEKNVEVVMKL